MWKYGRIQCATAEIRRGKKIERKKKLQGKNIMSESAKQGRHKKTKPRYSCLVRHPAWKWREASLVSALHKICHLLRHLPTYLQCWDPHGAIVDDLHGTL